MRACAQQRIFIIKSHVVDILTVSHHKQPPCIRYTTDVGVLNWVCTQCRSGCNNWLLCCDCFKPLHYDCSYIDFPSDYLEGCRDYMCRACYMKLPCGKSRNLKFTENVTFTVYFSQNEVYLISNHHLLNL